MSDEFDRKIERLAGDLTLPPTISEVHDAIAKLPLHDGRPGWLVPRYGRAQFGMVAARLALPIRRPADPMEFVSVHTDEGPIWAYSGKVLCVPFTAEQLRAMVEERQDNEAQRRNRSCLRLLRENLFLRIALQEAGVPLPEKVSEMDRADDELR